MGITTADVRTNTLVVSGVSTLGVTSTTNLTSQQLNVSGISTFNGKTRILDDVEFHVGTNGVFNYKFTVILVILITSCMKILVLVQMDVLAL